MISRDALLAAALPGTRTRGFWSEFDRAAPPIVKLGLRTAAWVLPFVGLRRASRSRFLLLRQLALVVKLAACLARFRA